MYISTQQALVIQQAYAILIVKVDPERTDYKQLASMDKELADLRGRGFDLILPVQFDAREWEHNATFFDELIGALGDSRIGNPLPHCTRIEAQYEHGGIIWDLPVPHLQKPYEETAEFILKEIQSRSEIYVIKPS